jgi:hypothetical protein
MVAALGIKRIHKVADEVEMGCTGVASNRKGIGRRAEAVVTGRGGRRRAGIAHMVGENRCTLTGQEVSSEQQPKLMLM